MSRWGAVKTASLIATVLNIAWASRSDAVVPTPQTKKMPALAAISAGPGGSVGKSLVSVADDGRDAGQGVARRVEAQVGPEQDQPREDQRWSGPRQLAELGGGRSFEDPPEPSGLPAHELVFGRVARGPPGQRQDALDRHARRLDPPAFAGRPGLPRLGRQGLGGLVFGVLIAVGPSEANQPQQLEQVPAVLARTGGEGGDERDGGGRHLVDGALVPDVREQAVEGRAARTLWAGP